MGGRHFALCITGKRSTASMCGPTHEGLSVRGKSVYAGGAETDFMPKPIQNPCAHVKAVEIRVDSIWTGPISRCVFALANVFLALWAAGTISGAQLCGVAATAVALAVGVSLVKFKWEYPVIDYPPEEVKHFRELLARHTKELQRRGLPPSGLNAEQVEFYRQNGFLFIPNFIDAELAHALHKSTAGLKRYTFHWNYFEDFTFKTYNNSIESQIVREWYENGPLKWVGMECNQAVLGEMEQLKPGQPREALETQEQMKERLGSAWQHPVKVDDVHRVKRGEMKLDKSMDDKEWQRLSSSLRIMDKQVYRGTYGYLYEYFCQMATAPSNLQSRFKRAAVNSVRLFNELILGVVGANDGIGFHWDRGSYSQLHHDESAVSTWLQLSEEGPGMSILRIRDVSEESWNEGLQGQTFDPASDKAKKEVDEATIPCPSSAGTLIIFDRREIHRTTPINRDYPLPFGERVVSVARWVHPEARLAGGGSDAPLWAKPNAMQAYMLGSRNYFMRHRDASVSLYDHSKKKPVKEANGSVRYPQADDSDMKHIFPDLMNHKLPTHKEVTHEYNWLTLARDLQPYYMDEFWQKYNGGKLATLSSWARLIKEFPLHSRFGGYTKKNPDSKVKN